MCVCFCRNGKDFGRSVCAKGLWCDILCSPFHSFGTLCEDEGFYKTANKEFRYTAVDISERNILALMHELDTEKEMMPKETDRLYRAAAARGPTDAEVCTATLYKSIICYCLILLELKLYR
jgi:hypothetical protein